MIFAAILLIGVCRAFIFGVARGKCEASLFFCDYHLPLTYLEAYLKSKGAAGQV